MAEPARVCGIPTAIQILPSDPSNNAVLTAAPAFGGIDVSWTYPSVNPHAVAHTLLFRGTTNLFANAIQWAIVAGNEYFDRTDPALTTVQAYYYWIKIVSINGTVGDLIGPAGATAKPNIQQTIELLSGKIESGVLAGALRDKINTVDLLGTSITNEVTARLNGDASINSALTTTQNIANGAITLIGKLNQERITSEAAISNELSLRAVGFDKAIAGIADELALKATATSAMAKKVTTVEASINGNVATGQVGLTATVDALKGTINAMYTAKVQVNGLIGGFGIVNTGTNVEAGFDVNTFWVGKDSVGSPWLPNTSYVVGTIATYGGYSWKCIRAHISSVTTTPGGGMGMQYWIQAQARSKPFIVENDTVFIDSGVINKLTFSQIRNESGSIIGTPDGKIKAAFLEAQSAVIKNSKGEIVLQDGNGTFSGAISVNGATYTTGNGFWTGMDGSVAKLRVGNTTQYLQWDGTNLEIKLAPFTVTLTPNNIFYSNAAPTYNYTTAAITPTITGGVGTKTVKWTLAILSRTKLCTLVLSNTSQTSTTLTAHITSPDEPGEIIAVLTCLVTDANGRTCEATTDIYLGVA